MWHVSLLFYHMKKRKKKIETGVSTSLQARHDFSKQLIEQFFRLYIIIKLTSSCEVPPIP